MRKKLTYRNTVMFLFITIIIAGSAPLSEANGQLQMEVPQNVLIPGESLWYGLSTNASHNPYVYVTLYNAEGIIIENNIHQLDQPFLTARHDIPLGLKPGSYILSANIRDQYNYEVFEEQNHIIHVLGEGNGQYLAFGPCPDGSLRTTFDQSSVSALEDDQMTRNNVCNLEDVSSNLISVAHEDLSLYTSVASYSSGKLDGGSDLKTRFVIDGESTENWLALYDYENRKIHVADINETNGEFLVPSSGFTIRHELQAVNAYNGQKLQVVEMRQPTPKWKCSNLETITFDTELKNKILKRSQDRLLINQIFKTNTPKVVQEKEVAEIEKTEPDRLINVKSYEVFESVELFLDEAISAMKLLKKKDIKDIVLVHGDKRGFYSNTPLIIIDGKIESNIDSLLAIPYMDLERMIIYRTKKKLDAQFGIMGRNGVLIVETKNIGTNTIHNIVISGPETGNSFSKPVINSLTDNRPHLSGIQYFGLNTGSRFCYDHNDETGTFLLKSIDTKNPQRDSKTYSFKVNIRQSQ